jgi:hypothetical protein
VRISGPATGSRAARQAIWTDLAAAGVDVIADLDQAGLAHSCGATRCPINGRHPAVPDEQKMNGG